MRLSAQHNMVRQCRVATAIALAVRQLGASAQCVLGDVANLCASGVSLAPGSSVGEDCSNLCLMALVPCRDSTILNLDANLISTLEMLEGYCSAHTGGDNSCLQQLTTAVGAPMQPGGVCCGPGQCGVVNGAISSPVTCPSACAALWNPLWSECASSLAEALGNDYDEIAAFAGTCQASTDQSMQTCDVSQMNRVCSNSPPPQTQDIALLCGSPCNMAMIACSYSDTLRGSLDSSGLAALDNLASICNGINTGDDRTCMVQFQAAASDAVMSPGGDCCAPGECTLDENGMSSEPQTCPVACASIWNRMWAECTDDLRTELPDDGFAQASAFAALCQGGGGH